MTEFHVHSKKTAPEKSVASLEQAEKLFGFVPNLAATMAESPAVLEAYLALGQFFDKSSFSRAERQVALLAVNRYHECRYCMAAHSTVAEMQKVPADVIEAIRDDQPIQDPRLEALRVFATKLVEKRGWVSDEDIGAFLSEGYTKAQVLEVVLGVSYKTLSNYVNHIANPPVDEIFASKAWSPRGQRAA